MQLIVLGDQQGTIRDLATYDAVTGLTSIATHITYDAYGNVTSTTHLNSTAVDCLFKYTGRAFDTATGLQNNWHRIYDAKTGRWLSKDPISYTAGQTNLYVYCANSPTNATDPTGLDRRILGWSLFHARIEIRNPKTGKTVWLEFGPEVSVFGNTGGGYAVLTENSGTVPLTPWITSTPEQDQKLIDLWNQLNAELKDGKRLPWSRFNNCWVAVLRYFLYGIEPDTIDVIPTHGPLPGGRYGLH